jgi:probable rRNA maturation factor
VSTRVDVQVACEATDLPAAEEIVEWACEVLRDRGGERELTVRIVDEAEGAALNRTFRGRPEATNVLSFAIGAPPGCAGHVLGDVAICAPVVAREAREQSKAIKAHYAHLVVHGTLHLLGYDHRGDEDAREMESLERALLARLGFADPYAESPA